ncbi:MAG: hypothetical protein ACXVEW_12935 [Solirubrobacteraceae bacterium]
MAIVLATVGVPLAATSPAAAQGTISATCTVGGVSAPCSSGWYTSPVSVVWQADAPATSTSGCAFNIVTNYTSDLITTLSCNVLWTDGTSSSLRVPLHLETSTPTMTASTRSPDAAGWYDHPVTVSFSGSSFSGITSCTPPVTYAGPATAGTSVGGSCVDNAGKLVSTTLPLAYDATPPAVTAGAQTADRSVALRWSATDVAPIASVTVIRTPGIGSVKTSTVYAGDGDVYRDERVRNGRHYVYTIIARDQAGNTSVQTVGATPNPRLLAPLANAHVSSPPLLSWTPVRGATYYNVQLYRSSKVLSVWPKRADLRLRRTWKFHGRRYTLKPGRYTWYVWPGFGKRSAGRYGRTIGHGTFVVMPRS